MTVKATILLTIFPALLVACSQSDSEIPAEVPEQSMGTAPYRNPQLANSTWPTFHSNNYATASVTSIGPGLVDSVQSIDALTDLGDDPFVSPWLVVGEPYSDGSQPIFATPNNGAAKYLIRNDQLEAVHFLPLERSTFDFDWALLALNDNRFVVTERQFNRIVIVGDVESDNSVSDLEVKARIDIDIDVYGPLLSHHSLAPDGKLIALTEANKLIAVDLDLGEVIADIDLSQSSGASFQNSFPIDETGRLFVAAQQQVLAVDWRNSVFTLAWTANYDMRGPGCEGVNPDRPRLEEILAVARGERCTGTGTTPSLLGTPANGVFVIVDGHAPQNNLVAFWRGTPPEDWEALDDPNNPGSLLDRRVAGVLPLPLSTPEGDGFTAQNSPATVGNSVVVAQWAGFNPPFNSPAGLQRVDWLPGQRQLSLVWQNPNIHFNGVPTIACFRGALCQVYGAGRYRNRYDYVSVDFDTGEETGRVLTGLTDDVLDQGNGHAIANDGSIVYAGKNSIIRVKQDDKKRLDLIIAVILSNR